MNRIRGIRKRCGVTQEELADLIGTSQQQIQRFENGEGTLSLDLACKISGALKSPLADLFPAEIKKAYRFSDPGQGSADCP